MNCRQARDAIEDILNGGETPDAYPELEGHLGTCANCRARYRRERQAIQRLEGVELLDVPPDFGQRVMDRLPEMPLEALSEVVRAVLRAWREPVFREQLRSEPRSTLERLGVPLPSRLRVIVVSPDQATLPTQSLLALPLPAAGEGSLGTKELQAQMRDSAAAFWLVPESAMARLAAEERMERVPAAGQQVWDSLVTTLIRPARRRVLVPVLAAAATFLLALGLLYLFGVDAPSGTPGAATGPWSGVAIAAVVLAAVFLAVSLILWRRKE